MITEFKIFENVNSEYIGKCVFIETPMFEQQMSGLTSIIISESRNGKLMTYYPKRKVTFQTTVFVPTTNTTIPNATQQRDRDEMFLYNHKNDPIFKDYGLKNIDYLYRKYPDEMVVVANSMMESKSRYKKSINNVLNLWFEKVPYLKIRLEADKYNL